MEKIIIFREKKKMEKKGWVGVSDSRLDVRKRGGGVIQMRTVCNRRGWGGGSKNREKMRT